MFPPTFLYHIPAPTNRFEKLQNFLGNFLEIIGKISGLLCIRKNPRTSKFEKGSRFLILWSTFIVFYQCAMTLTILLKFSLTLDSDKFIKEKINMILQDIVSTTFFLMMSSLSITAVVKRNKIVELLNEAIELQRFCTSEKTSCTQMKQKLVTKLMVKVILDAVMVGCTSIYQLIDVPGDDQKFLTQIDGLFIAVYPFVMTSYCYFTTTYFITFAFVTFLLNKSCNSLNEEHAFHAADIQIKILCFGRKVNKMLQSTLAFFMIEGLIAFVNQVMFVFS